MLSSSSSRTLLASYNNSICLLLLGLLLVSTISPCQSSSSSSSRSHHHVNINNNQVMSPPSPSLSPTKQRIMNFKISTPTLIVDKARCIANIRRMSAKTSTKFAVRPHCKTHACLEIANWLYDYGSGSHGGDDNNKNNICGITVSSLSMAEYFVASENNNKKKKNPILSDITVAFPLNILELDKVKRLLQSSSSSNPDLKLNLLVENVEGVDALMGKDGPFSDNSDDINNNNGSNLRDRLGLFIKIDVGYGRTGIPANDADRIDLVVQRIAKYKDLVSFKGFLTHSGHTYHCRTPADVQDIYDTTTPYMTALKEKYITQFPNLILSMGDTPTCSIVDGTIMANDFDEMRPGNYVFYDLEQAAIGGCKWTDIAVAVACPIVAKHPQRREIVVYGGGVHCSKDRMVVDMDDNDNTENNNNNINNINNNKNSEKKTSVTIFGRVVRQKPGTMLEWGSVIKGMYVRSLSQEHGIIVVPPEEDFDSYEIGSLVFILPVHSCMMADALKHEGYVLTDGTRIERMKN